VATDPDDEASSDGARGDDLREDRDLPPGIRYDPDLAVHEPATAATEPLVPSRKRWPLVLIPFGILALSLSIYVVFGLVAREGMRSADYLEQIRLRRSGGWQAAFELSRLIPIEDARQRTERFVPELISLFEASRTEDPRLRGYLALCLGELRDTRGVDPLLGALRDDDLQTRIYAVWSLGAIGDARAAPAILPLLSSEESDLRKIAAYSLGSMEAPEAAPALRALLNDPVEDVAWNAALALARQHDPGGLPLLLRMLDRAYLDAVRRPDEAGRPRPLTDQQKEEAILNALRSIGRLGDREHLADLRRTRERDPSLRVRQAALETLSAIEDGR
jgi:HEAT repeats